ncbi:DUF3422 domain-containing protein [Maribrevibacterium harenarium]|uniref:DUF3422 domain-containing protein n=1 Tax=Maribrevibacterium harenarium TaxID=2589817 RepID=A0A501WXB0_9GAMM|nr:DUF3422 domain-containing protein [Maribrevibacterium harenarium]TPE51591.1 DUF3422 domain-containing protein [Maribrevibacterium harenarium]
MATTNPFGLNIHQQRDALYAELHSRPFQVIPSPARISYLAVMMDAEEKESDFDHFCGLLRRFGAVVPGEDSVCLEIGFGHLRIRREKHLEFISYLIVNEGAPFVSDPWVNNGLSCLPKDWLAGMPGTVISALHVAIEDARDGAEPDLAQVKSHFEGMRLVGSRPQNGDAQVWTSFQVHSDGCGRMMVFNRGMSNSQLGRMVQRLIEIETYRLMALMGLPLARYYNQKLAKRDKQLAEITAQLSETEEEVDEQEVLAKIIRMAAWVEAARAKTTFRFSATAAYHDLVLKRLSELKEDEVSGHLTVTEFMTRRLTPAVRTCNATGEHLENLSRRIDRVSDMMRTRVEMAIQSQNQHLLASMDRRSKIQLAMQHTVEGLSVAAISYYSIGLIKYLIDAAYENGAPINKSLAIGIAVPVMIGGVWWATRRIHKRFLKLAKEQMEIGEGH